MHTKKRFCVTNNMLNILKPTIAVIDSGIGGISVLSRLIAKYKAGNFLYFADNLFMPYGNKTATGLKNRLEAVINQLNKFYMPDIILIACNTASSVIDDSKFPNVKTIKFNNNGTYLTTKLTKRQLKGYNVLVDASLASVIERNINKPSKLAQKINQHSRMNNLASYDSIILGCTHFELVKSLFEKCCKNTKFLCNSDSLIDNIDFKPNQSFATIKVILSKKDERYSDLITGLIKQKVEEACVEFMDI